MALQDWVARAEAQSGAPGLRAVTVSRQQWSQATRELAAGGARLLSIWASGEAQSMPKVHAAFLSGYGGLLLTMTMPNPDLPYPGLQEAFPAAARMQRAMADLSGLRSTDPDTRPWLRHAAWPQSYRPLSDPPELALASESESDAYEFVQVSGEGVHEIAVGPVHAGTIEPGHFRFSVVGEKVLRLEERLGYVHKGIEQRFTQLPILEAHRLAARVSGDSAVAFSWAYCQALEGISGADIPSRAAWLRALCLELERIGNHLGDLGALGNDAGFAFGLSQFLLLKEQLLRTHHETLGERYLMNTIVPGGTRMDLSAPAALQLGATVKGISAQVRTLRAIYDEHEGLRDRFTGAGAVTPELAAKLGLIGLAGRASGQAFDLRVDMPCEVYAQLAPAKIGRSEGDVAARVGVRFDELQESCRLVQAILDALPHGPHLASVRIPPSGSVGAGLIEGWRGPVFVALEAAASGGIRRCHPHDPSWQNWPALEHAIMGNIVPDFPLINKSFNLSYSGHDL
jgi:Ni,Fe-hydrogenase III large subunit/Ni,Fe-hydrogenase III component G